MAVAMVTFFWAIGIELSLSTVIVSHIAFTIPFVAVVVRARMAGFDKSLEEASRDLGASEWQTFWYVTFPYMIPGLVAGALMAAGAILHILQDMGSPSHVRNDLCSHVSHYRYATPVCYPLDHGGK